MTTHLWKDGRFQSDPWRYIEEGEDVPPSGHIILPLDWWQSQRAIFEHSHVAVGVRLDPGEKAQALVEDLNRLSLIVLRFPSFADGRAFSTASVLRGKFNYHGLLRANGDVLIDQIGMMQRCGFDEFEITSEPALNALRNGAMPQQTLYYQPALGPEISANGPSWRRRRSV